MFDSKKIENRLAEIHHIKLANRPTPIETCQFLTAGLKEAPYIHIKRDDYIGYLVGGNKVRKLEYVMAEALKQKATAVVTIGSIQSNHARTTAMVARRFGLKCELILNGDPHEPPCANYLINKKLGIPIHLVPSREERIKKMDSVATRMESEGERVYRIPLGASDSMGTLGFVTAFVELQAQEKELGIQFDHIIISSSSGGTQAGLEIGKRLFDRSELEVIGISPDDPSLSIKRKIAAISRPVLNDLGASADIHENEIEVIEDFIGAGYGIPTPASKEAAAIFNQLEGILLDPVYTAKAAAGMLDLISSGRFKPESNVLFWHTGGLMSLFCL